MRKRARVQPGTSCAEYSVFLFTRWLRNILFVLFFEEGVAGESILVDSFLFEILPFFLTLLPVFSTRFWLSFDVS
jgi:hypothetical protein